jgi:hypothetical protein
MAMRGQEPDRGQELRGAAFCIEFQENTVMTALGDAGRDRHVARRILQYEARMLRDLGLERESLVLAGMLARLAN